jgi:hypothetical protein
MMVATLFNQSLNTLFFPEMVCPVDPVTQTPLLATNHVLVEFMNEYLNQFSPHQLIFTVMASMSVISFFYPRITHFMASITFLNGLQMLSIYYNQYDTHDFYNPAYILILVGMSITALLSLMAIRKTVYA